MPLAGVTALFPARAEPNDANAPDPRPNALDAPVVGEVKPPGDIAPAGGRLKDELSWRLLEFKLRRAPSLVSEVPSAGALLVDSDSLLELERRVHKFSITNLHSRLLACDRGLEMIQVVRTYCR